MEATGINTKSLLGKLLPDTEFVPCKSALPIAHESIILPDGLLLYSLPSIFYSLLSQNGKIRLSMLR